MIKNNSTGQKKLTNPLKGSSKKNPYNTFRKRTRMELFR